VGGEAGVGLGKLGSSLKGIADIGMGKDAASQRYQAALEEWNAIKALNEQGYVDEYTQLQSYNQMKLAEEQMKLYKETGVSPFGSCLPTLIQFPIIIGLYQSIIKAMAATPLEIFRLERLIYPFLDANKILPIQNRFLWMDLGQPERLPILGIQIPILAIIVVATTWLQSKAMEPPSTGVGDQAAAMTKSMNIYMPVLMGWMAYSLASGLALYFLVSNIATVVQYSAQGRANWSRLFPWIKTKSPEPIPTPVVVIPDDEEEDEEPEAPKPASKPSARAAVKQQRPQYKRKK